MIPAKAIFIDVDSDEELDLSNSGLEGYVFDKSKEETKE